jgi:hypothetical protein
MTYGPNFHASYAETFKLRKIIHSLSGTKLKKKKKKKKKKNELKLVNDMDFCVQVKIRKDVCATGT